jgi:hypothetical protein
MATIYESLVSLETRRKQSGRLPAFKPVEAGTSDSPSVNPKRASRMEGTRHKVVRTLLHPLKMLIDAFKRQRTLRSHVNSPKSWLQPVQGPTTPKWLIVPKYPHWRTLSTFIKYGDFWKTIDMSARYVYYYFSGELGTSPATYYEAHPEWLPDPPLLIIVFFAEDKVY